MFFTQRWLTANRKQLINFGKLFLERNPFKNPKIIYVMAVYFALQGFAIFFAAKETAAGDFAWFWCCIPMVIGTAIIVWAYRRGKQGVDPGNFMFYSVYLSVLCLTGLEVTIVIAYCNQAFAWCIGAWLLGFSLFAFLARYIQKKIEQDSFGSTNKAGTPSAIGALFVPLGTIIRLILKRHVSERTNWIIFLFLCAFLASCGMWFAMWFFLVFKGLQFAEHENVEQVNTKAKKRKIPQT